MSLDHDSTENEMREKEMFLFCFHYTSDQLKETLNIIVTLFSHFAISSIT